LIAAWIRHDYTVEKCDLCTVVNHRFLNLRRANEGEEGVVCCNQLGTHER
jgi:hypothetical protein